MASLYILVLTACWFAYVECIYWEPVFVGYKENGESIYNRWINTQTGSCTLNNGCLSSFTNIATLNARNKHLKSKLVNGWNGPNFRIKQVRVELWNNRTKQVVGWMEFDGRNSNKINWFSKNKLLRSSWEDMFSDGCYNYFSVAGHRTRRFFINQNYGGCPNDLGWLQIIDSRSHPCPWDRQTRYPVFLYAPRNHKAKFYNRRYYGKADVFAIYVKRL